MPTGSRRRKMIDRKAIVAFLADLDHDLGIIETTRSQLVQDIHRHDAEIISDAVHEAGHCVAAWAMGFPIVEMDLREEYPLFGDDHPISTTWQVDNRRLSENYAGTTLLMPW